MTLDKQMTAPSLLRLPRELRNQSYGYLLDEEYAKVPRQKTDKNAYKFHTKILGVNRQCHDEAEYLLLTRNDFVDVTQTFDVGISDLSKEIQLWAPLVSTINMGQMKHCSLSINLSYSSLGLSRTKAQTRLKGSPSTNRFLMLSKRPRQVLLCSSLCPRRRSQPRTWNLLVGGWLFTHRSLQEFRWPFLDS